VDGSNETVMKTGFGFSGGRHSVKFGANARHISDLADLDENYFVLLGGQDGWLGSTTFLDQLPLWRNNESIRVPLRPETIAAEFPYLTVLAPSETAAEISAPERTEYSAARSRRS
jgi:penicillin amidase